MRQRPVLAFALGLLLLAGSVPALAASPECGVPDGRGVRRCAVGLPLERLPALRIEQQRSQWCWAAALAMVSRWLGREVAQAEIVRSALGSEIDVPAAAATLLHAVEDMAWQPLPGAGLTREDVRRSLAEGRPLLLGAAGHLVVLARIDYEEYTVEGGWRVLQGHVIDPAPGAGVRPLRPAEFRPTLLAAGAPADGGLTLR